MIATAEELEAGLKNGSVKLDPRGHRPPEIKHLVEDMSVFLLMRRFRADAGASAHMNDLRFPVGGPGGCPLCGEFFYYVLDSDDINLTASKPCPAPDIDKQEWAVKLACPSGELLLFNDLREPFEDADHDVNSLLGEKTYSEHYAKQGLGIIFVGNTCPGVYQASPSKLIVASGNYDKEEEAEQALERLGTHIGGICTDLWWYSVIDKLAFMKAFRLTPDSFEEKCRAKGWWPQLIRAVVEPGVYEVTRRKHLTNEDELVQVYSTIRKIKCTAYAEINHGVVSTHSCTTGRPLIDRGSCNEGCCDDYECTDCGHRFRVEWPD